MKTQRLTAALTAATIAFASLSATLPTFAFAETVTKTITYQPNFSDTTNVADGGQTNGYSVNIWEPGDDLKAALPADMKEGSAKITKATFTYTVSGDVDDFCLRMIGNGWNADGDIIECDFENFSRNTAQFTGIAKTGTISTDSAAFTAGFEGIVATGWLDVCAISETGTGELTLAITDVALDITYEAEKTYSVTGTQTYAFADADAALLDEIGGRSTVEVGHDEWDQYANQLVVGDWVHDAPAGLNGITTVADFAAKYNSAEFKFTAADITGNAEICTIIETGNEDNGEYQAIVLDPQDIKEGKNTYTANFGSAIKSPYDTLSSVSVHIRAKNVGETATMKLGTYDSNAISATGSEVLKYTIDDYGEVVVEMPEYWDPDWGSCHQADIGIWYFGMGTEPNTCLVDTVSEFYGKYKGGEISFNAIGVKDDILCSVSLQTRNGNDFGEEIALSNKVKVVNGVNTIKFDLPDIFYINPDIWGLDVKFTADKDTAFEIIDANVNSITATGTETFKSDPAVDYNEISVVTPDWWNPADGEHFEADLEIWNYGGGDYPNTCLANTVAELYAKYKGGEIAFNVCGLKDDVAYQVVLITKTGDEYGEDITLADGYKLQNGTNTVKFDLPQILYQNPEILGIVVRFFADKETSFAAANTDYTNIKATGTETFKTEFDGKDVAVSIETPEWWDTAWGPLYEGGIGVWYYGMGTEPNTCLENTVPDMYGKYKGGEITFNVSDLNADVTCAVELQTREGDNFRDSIVLIDGIKLRNGSNTIAFDLPESMYKYPDIWGIYVRMSADKETRFTVNKSSTEVPSEPSTPSLPSTPSTPSTSEPTNSETTSGTEETFKTEDKPLADIMEEVKPDSTASIEVAPEDTTIKKDVFEQAKEKKVTLELKLDNGVKWAIKAETIGSGAADVNINVELNTSNVPSESVESVAAGKTTMQISLAHEGSFGFEAEITIPVATANNGKYANLFHFNNGAMEFVASVLVSGGEATLPFSHASEYVIVFDEKSMGVSDENSESNSGDASNVTSDSASVSGSAPETNNNNPVTGAAGVGAFAALTAASALAVIICRKHRNK